MDEQLHETIELDMDEENELLFKINVEGADAPAKVRLVCEGKNISYMFDGHPTDESGVVQFLIPEMKNYLREAAVLGSRIEVMIENKFFSPVQFNLDFKKQVQVFAESVKMPVRKKTPIAVSVEKVSSKKKVLERQPAKIAKPVVRSGSLAERWRRRRDHKK